jgi:hypothetical protein
MAKSMVPRVSDPFFFAGMLRVTLRTGSIAFPWASCPESRSMKVARRLTSLARPVVANSTSQSSGRNLWTAASATLKARIVRTSTLLPTYFSAASAGPAVSNRSPNITCCCDDQ